MSASYSRMACSSSPCACSRWMTLMRTSMGGQRLVHLARLFVKRGHGHDALKISRMFFFEQPNELAEVVLRPIDIRDESEDFAAHSGLAAGRGQGLLQSRQRFGVLALSREDASEIAQCGGKRAVVS